MRVVRARVGERVAVRSVVSQNLPAWRADAEPIVGGRSDWAAELTLLGLVYGFLGPTVAGGPLSFALGASFVAALSGAVLGAAIPGLLDRARRRRSWATLPAGGMVLGTAWGMMAGAGGVMGTGLVTPLLFGVTAGGIAGALLGLFAALPLVIFHVLRIPRTSVLAVACAAGPPLGWISGQLTFGFLNKLFGL